MPQIGHRVRVTFRDGRVREGILVDMYTECFIYLHMVIRFDDGETVDLCINDISEGVACVEDLEM